MTTKRKHYTKAFNLEAARLLERGDKPSADITRELGIKRTQLLSSGFVKWRGSGACQMSCTDRDNL